MQDGYTARELPDRIHLSMGTLSGWGVGIALGVWITIILIPNIRSIVESQLESALPFLHQEWVHPPSSHGKQMKALRTVAENNPANYLIQIGYASLLLNRNLSQNSETASLKRILVVTDRFPRSAGALALLTRSILQEGILQKPSVQESDPEIRLLTAALSRGRQIDPGNAFWCAMQACLYMKEHNNNKALTALSNVRVTDEWNSYLYEQVLGQWKLYSLAYGNHGAAQKVAPISLLGFPQLEALQSMAKAMQVYSSNQADMGHMQRAVNTRHYLARLAQILRTSSWAYEALYGSEITLIAATDPGASLNKIVHSIQWPAQAHNYLVLLKNDRREQEAIWMAHQVHESLKLRYEINNARDMAHFPGVPPGIPLGPLFGTWMTGVILLRQQIVLGVISVLLCLTQIKSRAVSNFIPLLTILVASIMTVKIVAGDDSVWTFICFLFSYLFLEILVWNYLFLNKRSEKASNHKMLLWSTEALVLITVILFALTTLLIRNFQILLANHHPVAIMLSSISGIAHNESNSSILEMCFLSSSLPFIFLVLTILFSWVKDVAPLKSITELFRSLFLTNMLGLLILYLFSLQATTLNDHVANAALSQVVKNDRQWVLNHSKP